MDDFNLSKKFIYPYGSRWILISFILVCSCFILATFSLGERIPLFLLYTLIVTAMFVPIKYNVRYLVTRWTGTLMTALPERLNAPLALRSRTKIEGPPIVWEVVPRPPSELVTTSVTA